MKFLFLAVFLAGSLAAQEYTAIRIEGKVVAVQTPNGVVSINSDGNKDWEAFKAWNAKQAIPLDMTDKVPAASLDPESTMQQRLIDYLKTDPQAVTPAQREAALRAIIRLVLRRENRLQDVDK